MKKWTPAARAAFETVLELKLYPRATILLRCAVLPQGPCERCAHYSRR
jgi:ribonuclease PH